MTELDILNLQASNIQSTGLYFIGLAFSIWVAFRVSSVVSQRTPDNMVMKVIAAAYGVCVVFYFNMTMAFYAYNFTSAGHRLAVLQADGGDVSALGQQLITNTGASTTPPMFSLLPSDPVLYVFMASVLAIILLPLFGPQPDSDA